jgi:hypothetical protein
MMAWFQQNTHHYGDLISWGYDGYTYFTTFQVEFKALYHGYDVAWYYGWSSESEESMYDGVA